PETKEGGRKLPPSFGSHTGLIASRIIGGVPVHSPGGRAPRIEIATGDIGVGRRVVIRIGRRVVVGIGRLISIWPRRVVVGRVVTVRGTRRRRTHQGARCEAADRRRVASMARLTWARHPYGQ